MRNYLLKMKALLLMTLLVTATILSANAQGREVTGTILDATLKDPLPGVTILVQYNKRGGVGTKRRDTP